MANITATMVKDLRDKTGAGMMDCKTALTETAGDMEAAIDWLRKKGISKAAKKAGRAAAEGLVGVAVDGNAGVLVEVNAETDFVARNDEFKDFVKDAAAVARWSKAATSKSCWPPSMGGSTVQQTLTEMVAKIGENMSIRRAVGCQRRSRRGRGLCPQCRFARAGQDRRAGGAEVHRRQGQAGGAGQADRHACRGRRAAGADAASIWPRTWWTANAPSRRTSRRSPASRKPSSRR